MFFAFFFCFFFGPSQLCRVGDEALLSTNLQVVKSHARGDCGLAAMSLSSLFSWMMQENERNMRDLTHGEERAGGTRCITQSQAFEVIIIGQNLARREMDHDRGVWRVPYTQPQLQQAPTRLPGPDSVTSTVGPHTEHMIDEPLRGEERRTAPKKAYRKKERLDQGVGL